MFVLCKDIDYGETVQCKFSGFHIGLNVKTQVSNSLASAQNCYTLHAVTWLTQAAEYGNIYADYALGKLYLDGRESYKGYRY